MPIAQRFKIIIVCTAAVVWLWFCLVATRNAVIRTGSLQLRAASGEFYRQQNTPAVSYTVVIFEKTQHKHVRFLQNNGFRATFAQTSVAVPWRSARGPILPLSCRQAKEHPAGTINCCCRKSTGRQQQQGQTGNGTSSKDSVAYDQAHTATLDTR